MWIWLREQVDKHFADVCLMTLIVFLLAAVITLTIFKQIQGLQVQPENVAWARESISAIIGCLLGRLAKIDQRSNGNGKPPEHQNS